MTMFIKLESGRPVGFAVTEDNLRQLFPDHTFPRIFTPKDVAPLGFGMYEWTQVPEPGFPMRPLEITPTLREDGIYYQTWTVVEMSDEEKAAATEAQSTKVKNERNLLLYRCDWTQLADSPLTDAERAAWASYRQTLRDLPQQAGFPWSVEWPVQPE